MTAHLRAKPSQANAILQNVAALQHSISVLSCRPLDPAARADRLCYCQK
jgi:hypothetical protein